MSGQLWKPLDLAKKKKKKKKLVRIALGEARLEPVVSRPVISEASFPSSCFSSKPVRFQF